VWPTGFVPHDELVADTSLVFEEMEAGFFRFIGEVHDVRSPSGWRPTDRTQLFRYHLHYFEWAWAFAQHNDVDRARAAFEDLWQSWNSDARYGRWDEWSPYVVALRVWVLCGVFERLVRGSEIEDEVRRSIASHAGYLAANIELDVGGNHLVKNLKALIGTSIFLGDSRLLARASKLLERELGIQVLPDGGHYERSPSYHVQVLGDLIDCEALIRNAGATPIHGLADAVGRMRTWLGTMLGDDGDVPLFGDCGLVGIERLAALGPIPGAKRRLTVLKDSGYVVARPCEGALMIVDVGAPCPKRLPAHAQAGCLTFELYLGGRRTIVDSGTSTYVGARRAYERSTAAHNTVEIDGANSSEVWSSFRCGRRARPVLHRATDDGERITIEASHDGYRFLDGSPVHRRTLTIGSSGLVIDDDVSGTGSHRAVGRIHVIRTALDGTDGRGAVVFETHVDGVPVVGSWQAKEVALGFGKLVPAEVMEVEAEGMLPLRLTTRVITTTTPEPTPERAPT
jgi:uncharacterized heparinase superfamily protein